MKCVGGPLDGRDIAVRGGRAGEMVRLEHWQGAARLLPDHLVEPHEARVAYVVYRLEQINLLTANGSDVSVRLLVDPALRLDDAVRMLLVNYRPDAPAWQSAGATAGMMPLKHGARCPHKCPREVREGDQFFCCGRPGQR